VTIVLAILILMAAPGQGGHPAAGLACAAMAAGFVDLLILRWKTGDWKYPSGAVLTAAIIVMVLRAQEPLYVTTVTSVIAVLSKYCFRSRGANVFNPAALAMIASYYLFHAGESWWGAQTDTIGLAKLLMVGAGVIVANRVNKMPLVADVSGDLFRVVYAHGLCGRCAQSRRDLPDSGCRGGAVFRVYHIDGPSHVAGQVSRPGDVRCAGRGGELCAVQSADVVYFLLAGVTIGNMFVAWRRAVKARRPYASVRRASYRHST
jgi:Na+-transporting NADH:ubiquinone oxidoreductase subunit NqrB